jgi:Hemerythrin HHE cation binding domain
METPVRGIRFIHRAILAEVDKIESEAVEGRSTAVAERLPFFERVLHLHNTGEEVGLFPDIEARAADVVPAYLLDHREEKLLFASLRDACARGGPNLVRAASAVAAHLRLHIKKEEELIVPLVERLFSIPEQGAQVGKMLAQFSPADMGQLLPWMITALEVDDRRAYLGLLEKVLPPDRLAGALATVKGGVTPEVWASLGR